MASAVKPFVSNIARPCRPRQPRCRETARFGQMSAPIFSKLSQSCRELHPKSHRLSPHPRESPLTWAMGSFAGLGLLESLPQSARPMFNCLHGYFGPASWLRPSALGELMGRPWSTEVHSPFMTRARFPGSELISLSNLSSSQVAQSRRLPGGARPGSVPGQSPETRSCQWASASEAPRFKQRRGTVDGTQASLRLTLFGTCEQSIVLCLCTWL